MPAGVMEYLWFQEGDEWWVVLIKAVVWLSVLVLFGIKSVDHVDTGQQALRRRFGKVVYHRRGPKKGQAVVVDAGFIPLVPFVHSLWKTSIQKQQLELRAQVRPKEHNRFNLVQTKIFYRLVNIEQALVGNQNHNDLIVSTCEHYLRQLIDARLVNADIEETLLDLAMPKLLEEYGAELMEVLVIAAPETDNSQLAAGLSASGLNPTGVALAAISLSGNGNGHHPVHEG